MRFTLYFFALLLFSQSLFSQNEKLRLDLDPAGETYIKAAIRGQFWARHTHMNPGTHIQDEPIDHALDFSVRRIRMGLAARLSPRVYVFAIMGNNNLNQKTAETFGIHLLDYYAEYRISEGLEIGVGKSAWGGQSRWNVRSTLSYMALDAPLFSLSTVNKNDDLGRTLGVWAKGQVGKFDYVLAVKEPVRYGLEAQEAVTDFALGHENYRYSAYMKYEFLDNESNKTAYSGGRGTHLGRKDIFNIGAGYMFQNDMMSSLSQGNEVLHDFKSWAVEAFYDRPINPTEGTALTSYLGYLFTDFGPNYIRNLGANGFTEGGSSFNGAGNAFPMTGTGTTIFFQLGYLMKKVEGDLYTTQLQPNLAIQYSTFDRLLDPMITYDIGVNYYIKGHYNKLTLGLQNRPIFNDASNGDLTESERRNMIVLQYQISIN